MDTTTQERDSRNDAAEAKADSYYKRLILKSKPEVVAWVKTAIGLAMREDGRVDWSKIVELQRDDPTVQHLPFPRLRSLSYALLNRRRSGYDKPHKCQRCKRRFLSKLALAVHEQRSHSHRLAAISTPHKRDATSAVGNSSRSKPKAGGAGQGWSFCPYCGGNLSLHGANFCHHCGRELR